MMSEETKIEVIKALAYGQSVEEVANFAEVHVEEIETFISENAAEIEERKRMVK